MVGWRARAAWLGLLLLGCGEDPVALSRPPTAFAGFDLRAPVGAEVALDGSQSFDPDGDPLAFRWRMLAAPEGSAASLEEPQTPLTRFVPDRLGTFVVGLTVDDGGFEDQDLVAIEVIGTTTAAEHLALGVAPRACNLSFATLPTGDCAGPFGAELFPEDVDAPDTPAENLAVEWTFVRLPSGLSTEDLQADLPTSTEAPLAFLPPRPGDYWVAARLVGQRATSVPTYATVRVHPPEVDLDALPIPRLDGPRQAQVRERVLLDARASTLTSSTAQLAWSFFVDPSDGLSALRDRATGCPQNRCRTFVPTREGTYVIRLDAGTNTASSAPALWTIDVTP